MTLVEGLIALVIGGLVLTTTILVFSSTRRVGHYSELAGALQDAALAMAILQEDLTQAVQKPDPSVDSAVIVEPGSFQLVRARIGDDGELGGDLVVYKKIGTESGNFRLKRQSGGKKHFIPGIFREVRFAQLGGPGGPFVRVTLRLSVHDRRDTGKPVKGSEEAVLTALVRIMGPELLGSEAFSWKILESVNAVSFLDNLLDF